VSILADNVESIFLTFYIHLGNPVNHFPVYEPSAERIADIAAAHSEENNPLNIHYDASREVRAKGAGFYQFSGDEETRRAQMEEMKASREETGKIRQETGALDVRPGDIEGMRDTGENGTRSRAMEKRKRDIEERRKLIEAKRRKVGDVSGRDSLKPTSASATETAQIEAKAPAPSSDPMAALEAKAKPSVKKSKTEIPSEADAFLAQLEKDFIGSRVR